MKRLFRARRYGRPDAATTFYRVALALGSLCGGCAPSDQPELAPVYGTVTLDGAPLAGKEVVFAPEGGRPSMGITNEQGEYELRYTARIDGAIIGRHRVTISTPPGPGGAAPRENIPAKYNVDSDLTAEVEDKNNEIDFELTIK